MKLKVDYLEIEKVEKTNIEAAVKLEDEIDYILGKLEELKDIWQGEDADVFYRNSEIFINRMKVLPNFLNVMGTFIGNSNKSYNELEDRFKKKLERERDKNEQDYYQRFE